MAGCTFVPELFTRRARSTNKAIANNSELHSVVSSTREQEQAQEDQDGNSSISNNNYIVPNFDQTPRLVASDQSVHRHHRGTRHQSQRMDYRRDIGATRERHNNNHGNSRVSYPEFIEGHSRSVEGLESRDGIVRQAMTGGQGEGRRYGALPEGWSMFVAPEGRQYFFHAMTGSVQWERPTEECR